MDFKKDKIRGIICQEKGRIMKKKVLFITGGAKGIGAAITELFSSAGYNILLHYNTSKEKAYALKERLEQQYHSQITLLEGDLADEGDRRAIVSKIKENYEHIDVFVNNAALSLDCDVLEKTKEEFMKVLEVNTVVPFLLIKDLHTNLHDGVVINISSTDAWNTGSVYNIDYCASKAGLNVVTKLLSDRFPNIGFYALEPNWVKTEAVLEMEPEYLKNELARIGQKELIEPSVVAKEIYNIVENKQLPSGSIIRIDEVK